jgi:hypothetical protein
MSSTIQAGQLNHPVRRPEIVALAEERSPSLRDKAAELRLMIAIVVMQLLFRAALLLRRWNY